MITVRGQFTYQDLKRSNYAFKLSGGGMLTAEIPSVTSKPIISERVIGRTDLAGDLVFSQKLTGTVSTTATDATVTGTGTDFVSDLAIGDLVIIDDTGEALEVLTITDATHFEATANAVSSEASSNAGKVLTRIAVEADKPINEEIEGTFLTDPGTALRGHIKTTAKGDLLITGYQ